MKLVSNTDAKISVEMTHDQALMIVALVRETCFGTVMHGFEARVGYPPDRVGEIAKQLYEILEAIDVTE